MSCQEMTAQIIARQLFKEIMKELNEWGECRKIINGKEFLFSYDDIRALDIWQGDELYDSVTSPAELRDMIEEELLYGVFV